MNPVCEAMHAWSRDLDRSEIDERNDEITVHTQRRRSGSTVINQQCLQGVKMVTRCRCDMRTLPIQRRSVISREADVPGRQG
ncbi:hypothetical protein ACFL6C_11425 [Myxococcota bacterium]